MSLIFFFYLFIILIYLAIGAAIIFHMLYYRIKVKKSSEKCKILFRMGVENPITIDLREYCDAANEHGRNLEPSGFLHEVPAEKTLKRVTCPLGIGVTFSVRPRVAVFQSGDELMLEVGCLGCDLKRGG